MKKKSIVALLLCVFLTACGSKKTFSDYYDDALKYVNAGNYQEAIIAFQQAIKIDPKGNPQVYISLAEAYQAIGDENNYNSILAQGLEATGGDSTIQSYIDNNPYSSEIKSGGESTTASAGEGSTSSNPDMRNGVGSNAAVFIMLGNMNKDEYDDSGWSGNIMQFNGTELVDLGLGDMCVGPLYIQNGWLYYWIYDANNGSVLTLHKLNISSGDVVTMPITTQYNYSYINQSNIYYVNDSGIYVLTSENNTSRQYLKSYDFDGNEQGNKISISRSIALADSKFSINGNRFFPINGYLYVGTGSGNYAEGTFSDEMLCLAVFKISMIDGTAEEVYKSDTEFVFRGVTDSGQLLLEYINNGDGEKRQGCGKLESFTADSTQKIVLINPSDGSETVVSQQPFSTAKILGNGYLLGTKVYDCFAQGILTDFQYYSDGNSATISGLDNGISDIQTLYETNDYILVRWYFKYINGYNNYRQAKVYKIDKTNWTATLLNEQKAGG